ncbi:hypothetical protein ABIC07_006001 [Bradyrhizobium sp. RT9a]
MMGGELLRGGLARRFPKAFQFIAEDQSRPLRHDVRAW